MTPTLTTILLADLVWTLGMYGLLVVVWLVRRWWQKRQPPPPPRKWRSPYCEHCYLCNAVSGPNPEATQCRRGPACSACRHRMHPELLTPPAILRAPGEDGVFGP